MPGELMVGYGLKTAIDDLVAGRVAYGDVKAVVPLATKCLGAREEFERWVKIVCPRDQAHVDMAWRLWDDGKLLHLRGLGVKLDTTRHCWVEWSEFSGGSDEDAGRSGGSGSEGGGA